MATRLMAPYYQRFTSGLAGGTRDNWRDEPDWSSMLGMMMPMLMFVMLGMVMVSAFKPKKRRKAAVGR